MRQLPSRIDRYEVRERIGQGGMGVLYLALDPAIDRLVALKVLRTDNEEVHERFIREAKSAGRLQHPNIITIYDVGEHEGQPFIAMEYIAGETLGEIIRRNAPVALGRRLELLGDLCTGLHYAHRAGIVHRDVKPSNVMVNRDGLLKVLDFGIARLADSSHTQMGVMMGTPNYMAPEQIENARVDHRADIFAVGAVAYELLTYRQAFSGNNHVAVLHKVLHETPAPIESFVPSIEPEIVRIVARAMEKSAAARYQDLAAMAAELARVRARLVEASYEPTVIIDTPVPVKKPDSGRRLVGREDFVKRRLAQVDLHLQAAREAFEAGDFDAALAAANDAALLDPDHAPTLDLLARIRSVLDERAAGALIEEAEQRLQQGELTEAVRLIGESSELSPSSRAVELHARIDAAIEARERERERLRMHARALDHARSSLDAGALESAIRAADEALAYVPASAEANEIKARAQERITERKRRDAWERGAGEIITAARARFAQGDREGALAALAAYAPPHPRVTEAFEALRREHQQLLDAERERAVREQRETRLRAYSDRAKASLDSSHLDEARAAIDEMATVTPLETIWRTRIAELRSQLAAEEAAARRQATVAQHVARAGQARASGAYDVAAKAVDEALALAPGDTTLQALAAEIAGERRAAEERERRAALDRRAAAVVALAEDTFARGGHDKAMALLAEFGDPHPAVTAAQKALRARKAEHDAEVARREAEEKARRDAEARERQQREAAEARARQDAEDKARRDAEARERQQREAVEARARQDAEEKARRDAEARERQQREAAEARARQDAEDKARRDAEARERQQREAGEARARQAAEEKARRDAEARERQQREAAEARARQDAEEKARRDAEARERQQREAAEARARQDAEEKARRDAEARERQQREAAEARAHRDAEEKARREAEQRARSDSGVSGDETLDMPADSAVLPGAWASDVAMREPTPVALEPPALPSTTTSSRQKVLVAAGAGLLVAVIVGGFAYSRFSGQPQPVTVPADAGQRDTTRPAEGLSASSDVPTERAEPVTPPPPPADTTTSAPDATTTLSTTTPTTASSATEDAAIADLLSRSRSTLARGRLPEALSLATQAQQRRPRTAETASAVSAVVDAATARARSAREAAVAVGGASQLAAFKTAEGAEAAARKVRTSDPAKAVAQYLDAERGYLMAADERRSTLAGNALADRQLAEWVSSRMTQARDALNQQRWQDAQQAYRDIKARAPQTPDIDSLIAQADRQRAAAELQQWATRQVAAAEQALTREQWDEAQRLVSEVRQRAPGTSGLDGMQTRIERGKAATAQRAAAAAAAATRETPAARPNTTPPPSPARPEDANPTAVPSTRAESPPTRDETPAVESVLRAFGQGYSQQSLDALKRVWPTMSASAADTYQRSFKSHTAQQWQYDRISVAIDGATAIATCDVRVSQQGIRDRQMQTESRRYRITLRQAGAGWQIVSLQFEGAR